MRDDIKRDKKSPSAADIYNYVLLERRRLAL